MEAEADSPRANRWAFVAALILSLATLASAWSGYEAARWGSEKAKWTNESTTALFDNTAQLSLANRHLSSDLLTFSVWLEAKISGDEPLATAVAERFRPDFLSAFEAWRATGAVDDDVPAGSPFDRSEYVLPQTVEAERLVALAEDAANRATEAGEVGDRYVLTAVLFASVLFLAGIATKMPSVRGTRLAVGLSVAMFLFASVVTFSLPISFGGLLY